MFDNPLRWRLEDQGNNRLFSVEIDTATGLIVQNCGHMRKIQWPTAGDGFINERRRRGIGDPGVLQVRPCAGAGVHPDIPAKVASGWASRVKEAVCMNESDLHSNRTRAWQWKTSSGLHRCMLEKRSA